MSVGYSEVSLHIHGVDSLKGKRRVLKSIIERLRGKFNISVAEVDQHDLWQASVIGLAIVSNDRTHIRQVLDAAVRQIEGSGEVDVVAVDTEIM
ncbi:DUF503 family protein [Heliobacterium gestii]|uniref:DUF503 family protein n=1 Tax=Heliomicrobium gestii TaxID=2699 RepID=A0A845LE01_HELGE|nr:DUF503 domain-containing protein [Heliomicrobium gestii]MBM7867327.1 uncharacterized protein YlxP (DUF503 family) [Heliomicrobium gestii]MZP43594.1 DUF503 family protein [Heliomicrobium gestii]